MVDTQRNPNTWVRDSYSIIAESSYFKTFLTRERFFTFITMTYPGYSSIFNCIIIVIIIPSIPCVTSLLIHTVLLPKTPTKLLVMLALLPYLLRLFFMAINPIDLLRKKLYIPVKKKRYMA